MSSLLQKFDIPRINSGAAIALGAVVMFGWKIESRMLTQIHPSFAAMQFNTALCFVISGISMACILTGYLKASRFFTGLLSGLAFATLIQYVVRVDFGIDLLLNRNAFIASTQYPGRMSPTTSATFSLLSLALISVSFGNGKRWVTVFAKGVSVVAFSIGLLSILGYFVGQNVMDSWHSYIRVAVHTAIGFCLLGSALYLHFDAKSEMRNLLKSRLFAGVACFSFIGIATGFAFLNTNHQLFTIQARQIEFEKLYGEIGRLDEILTMSARIGSATGDVVWEQRYNEFDPKLGKVIAELILKFPELPTSQNTDLANQRLVAMERESFSLTKSGRGAIGFALLNSPEYRAQKLIYQAGMDDGAKVLHQILIVSSESAKFRMVGVGSISLLFFVFAVAGSIFSVYRLNTLNQSIVVLNQTLESRVKSTSLILVQKAKLASLGEMSAGIAHEINNPLAIICGSIGQLAKFAGDPEKIRVKIENIQKASDRIARIVKGLKKFSRTSEVAVRGSHVLGSIVTESVGLMEAKIRQTNTPVSCKIRSESYISCDEVEIEQVIINLIGNAIDAVKDRDIKWVKLEVFDEGQVVILRVTDSGTGIPAHIAEKLFDPFFTTKKVGEGTGLGLSISKGILDEHMATISVLRHMPNTCIEIRFGKVMVANAA